MTQTAERDNRRGGAWLIADMALNIWALSLVKALGLDYPTAQIVVLRALVGLVLLAPFIWHQRSAFRTIPDTGLQALRVGLSALTLTASYYAIARVPLALFTTMNFTRPLIVMVLAALLLRERITAPQWAAAAVAMLGVVIAIDPTLSGALTGIAALAVVVLTGSLAVIVTRRLRSTPTIVLMTAYTGGLALCLGPFAWPVWRDIPQSDLLPLLFIGAFAQAAQACFLRAHFHGDAGVLSVLGYLSLPLSMTVGLLLFDETPTPRFLIGAALVVMAALSLRAGRQARR